MQSRKHDTREKIQLGGLVVKAGLRTENKAVILGMLLDAVARLNSEDSDTLKDKFRELGDAAFSHEDA